MYVPNCLFPSSNKWGIPDLPLSYCADYLHYPVMVYGSKNRSKDYKGTILFYTNDEKFNSIYNEAHENILKGHWDMPSKICRTDAITVSLLDYTVSLDSPLAYVIWCAFRRNWLACLWASTGIKVFCNVNFPTQFKDIMMLGIPRGWSAFCTRGYSDRLEALGNEVALAKEWKGDGDILFVVYGGGTAVREYCIENRLIWIAEEADRVRGVITKNGKPYTDYLPDWRYRDAANL